MEDPAEVFGYAVEAAHIGPLLVAAAEGSVCSEYPAGEFGFPVVSSAAAAAAGFRSADPDQWAWAHYEPAEVTELAVGVEVRVYVKEGTMPRGHHLMSFREHYCHRHHLQQGSAVPAMADERNRLLLHAVHLMPKSGGMTD